MAKKTIQIKNRYTEEVIFECEAETIKEAVEKAVKKKADLSEADLREANLSEADLSEANLWKADLWKADLWKANLWEADLWKANLRKADLNAVFFNTKVTSKQRKYIIEESDLFELVEDSSSNQELNKEVRNSSQA